MKKVFISYRRIDSADVTGRIYDRLLGHFGRSSVFMDVDMIPLGVDFRTYIQNAVAQCEVALVVIGKDWLAAVDYNGQHRLDDPEDFLRIEIEAVLSRGIPVIPVLVRGATVPAQAALPGVIRQLAFRHALEIRSGAEFHIDVDRLVRALEEHLGVGQRDSDVASAAEGGDPMTDKPPTTRSAAVEEREKPSSGNALTCLTEILHRSRSYTVITGSRRPDLVRSQSDILLPVSWTDFVLLGHLPAPERHCIVPDELFTQDWENNNRDRDVFRQVLVAVGAPDVNFAGLILNGYSLFRFVMEAGARNALGDLFDEVRKQPPQRQLEFLVERRKELDELVEHLCPLAIVDPFATQFVQQQALARFPHGLVSVALHPYGIAKPCVFAAGYTGPATAGAVSLLAGRAIFDRERNCYSGLETRPLGGVFRRRSPAKQPPDDVLHIEDDLEWVTPSYGYSELLERMRMLRTSTIPGVTRQDVDRLMELMESLSCSTVGFSSREVGKFRVVIPIGGQGVRMKEFTKGKISKTELPIPSPDTPADSRDCETVLGMLVRALSATGMVDGIFLLTRDALLGKHGQLARELAQRYRLNVWVDCDEGSPWFDVFSARLSTYSGNAFPTVLMMGDTLFHPQDLVNVFSQVNRDRPLLEVVCSQVSGEEASRYGMVDIDSSRRVCKIWEKPGEVLLRTASQGMQVFSPYVQWNQLVKASGNGQPSSPVEFFNHTVSCGIPVEAFIVRGPVYDCGSPEGYQRAYRDGENGRLW